MDMMYLEWHVGDVSSFEAMEFHAMNTTPERLLSVDSLPNQKRLKPAANS